MYNNMIGLLLQVLRMSHGSTYREKREQTTKIDINLMPLESRNVKQRQDSDHEPRAHSL